jgi:hypothetical protein
VTEIIAVFTETLWERDFLSRLPGARPKLVAQLRDEGWSDPAVHVTHRAGKCGSLQPHPGLGRVPTPSFFGTHLFVLPQDRSRTGVKRAVNDTVKWGS